MSVMSGLRDKIPSTQSLFAFFAAAEARNFGRAAEDLNVTQSSISHAVRKLENHLGTKLFHRANRGVTLTGDGQLLFDAVSNGFSGIGNAIDFITRREAHFVTIAVSTSMATYWLMPQLHSFYQSHPRIKLKILTTDKNPEPDDTIDLTIRRLPLATARKNAWLIAKEVVFPVCASGYLNDAPSLQSASDLTRHKLLFYEDVHRQRINWPEFLAALGVAPESIEPVLVFNDYQLVLQAAMAGEGLAIGWTITAKFLLERGNLSRPLPHEVSTDQGFFLLAQPGKKIRSEVADLVDWLLAHNLELR